MDALLNAEESDENVLAWAPGHNCWNPDSDEAAGELFDCGCVAAMHAVGTNVGYP